MTGSDLAHRLIAAGVATAELPKKTQRCDMVLTAFRQVAGTEPSHAWWIPGRLELFGKHTDYAGGRTIVAPVPRGFIVVAGGRTGRDIHVIDGGSGESVTISETVATHRGWRHYVSVAVSRLAHNFPQARAGATIAFASDLPRASGMSSSSALVVGVATALRSLWELPERDEWRRSIQSATDLATYYASIENGATFRGLAGDSGVGTHGGSEDHAAMLLGRPGSLSAFSFIPMVPLDVVPLPTGWTVVIAASGVQAAKTGDARAAYNRLSDGVAQLLAMWNTDVAPADSLAAVLASEPSAEARLRELISLSALRDWPEDALIRRLSHFQREDARVAEAIAALRNADARSLGDLSDASQREAAELLGNQVPETVALSRGARSCGAFASCSFGAGFGGSVWAVVEEDRAAAFAAEWVERYQQDHPHRAALSFLADPGPAASALA
ncbi:MAG: galactokinase family protein [Vicinamibacterales bacterium]